MRKRLKFKCWNCGRIFTLAREITDEQVLLVACPFCNVSSVVDLAPYKKRIKSVLKGNGQVDLGDDWNLPELLPTKKRTD